MNDTMTTLRDMENKLDGMDEAMKAMTAILSVSSATNDDDKTKGK